MAPPNPRILTRNLPSISLPSPNLNAPSRSHVLILFIPGNPGLIQYYAPFLTHLRSLLNQSESHPDSTTAFHLYGQNLLGFTDTDHPTPFCEINRPFNLEDQIKHVSSLISEKEIGGVVLPDSGKVRFDKILLMGHSVGAYIAVEAFHREHIRVSGKGKGEKLPLHSAILLFPTVVNIAQSPNGRRLMKIAESRVLDKWAHVWARWFLTLWQGMVLYWFLRVVIRLPGHAAGVTRDWLKGKDGVWQALEMGKDEMRSIGEEKWVEDMWGNKEEEETDKFVFLFGKGDSWVADECREEFIKRREGDRKGRVKVVVDEEGRWPHAFCLRHSEEVAERVAGWVVDMVGDA